MVNIKGTILGEIWYICYKLSFIDMNEWLSALIFDIDHIGIQFFFK